MSIYDMALKLVDEHNLLTVIDLNCGKGDQLRPFYERGMWLVGFDTLAMNALASGVFIQSANLNNAIPYIKTSLLQSSIIICSNLERLTNPANLLNGLRVYLETAPFAIISTADTDAPTDALPTHYAKSFMALLKTHKLRDVYSTYTDGHMLTVVLKGKT